MSAPSVQEAVEKLTNDFDCKHSEASFISLSCEVCFLSLLEKFARAAQVSALESVAKEMCDWCAREKHMPPATSKPEWNGWWHYDPGQISRVCKAGPIREALARLRQSASAPDER